jgi:hypothetical protein
MAKDKKRRCRKCGRARTRPGERICGACYHARRRERDPIAYRFYLLKVNAEQRGKEFDITLEEFRSLCKETGYHLRSGRHAEGLTIDRIDPRQGYTRENMQVITCSENSSKGNTTDRDLMKELGDPPEKAPF